MCDWESRDYAPRAGGWPGCNITEMCLGACPCAAPILNSRRRCICVPPPFVSLSPCLCSYVCTYLLHDYPSTRGLSEFQALPLSAASVPSPYSAGHRGTRRNYCLPRGDISRNMKIRAAVVRHGDRNAVPRQVRRIAGLPCFSARHALLFLRSFSLEIIFSVNRIITVT